MRVPERFLPLFPIPFPHPRVGLGGEGTKKRGPSEEEPRRKGSFERSFYFFLGTTGARPWAGLGSSNSSGSL
jgi:hypothetical protein